LAVLAARNSCEGGSTGGRGTLGRAGCEELM
jgi:hypothetical protein